MPRFYPSDLLPQLQHALAELADVEDRYEGDRSHLEETTQLGPIRKRLMGDLERRYRAERDPCVQRLLRLGKEMIIAKV
jgi:hypothetical protein